MISVINSYEMLYIPLNILQCAHTHPPADFHLILRRTFQVDIDLTFQQPPFAQKDFSFGLYLSI